MMKKTMTILILLSMGLYSNSDVSISEPYLADGNMEIQNLKIKADKEECFITYFTSDYDILDNDCLKTSNSKGIKIFCTKNKKVCKTENELKKLLKEKNEKKEKSFSKNKVLNDINNVWTDIFKQHGATYREPSMLFYRGETTSSCGFASAQKGAFYCPADKKVYIDLDFFNELSKKYNDSDDFARAYILAHEIGHHIQNMEGTLSKVQKMRQQVIDDAEANELQVKVELQADCYAGVWAYNAQKRFNILEQEKIEDALNLVSEVGEDTLQKQAEGYIVPDSFTHSSLKYRVAWFKEGMKTGDISSCDTFSKNIKIEKEIIEKIKIIESKKEHKKPKKTKNPKKSKELFIKIMNQVSGKYICSIGGNTMFKINGTKEEPTVKNDLGYTGTWMITNYIKENEYKMIVKWSTGNQAKYIYRDDKIYFGDKVFCHR